MRILVLGGTAWLGREIASAALRSGHDVTCLARGVGGDPIEGVRFVPGDRGRPDAYDEVASESWDGVIDVARDPVYVRGAVAALGTTTERWAFVSTGNVYADHSENGADETARLCEPLPEDVVATAEQYGPAKVACENAVLARFGDQALIARAGLIGGPGDESGRSGYWPWRFAHPSHESGDVLVPESAQAVSLIDVRDLATWLVEFVEGTRAPGIYDAIANRMTLPEFLAVAQQVAGHAGALARASNPWLVEHGVAEWMGPKSLPLWLADPDWQGFAGRSGAKIVASGFASRPLSETLADVLAWEESRDLAGPHGAGLADAEERALLAELADTVTFHVTDPTDPDAIACLRAYNAELATLFDDGWDPAKSLLPDPAEMRAPRGLFLLARLRGKPVGCVGLKRPAGKPAEIKRMWVAPEARGRGLSRQLLGEIEKRAIELGHEVVRLDTNRTLTAAIRLYESAGYVEIERFNDEPYAHHWFEKQLTT